MSKILTEKQAYFYCIYYDFRDPIMSQNLRIIILRNLALGLTLHIKELEKFHSVFQSHLIVVNIPLRILCLIGKFHLVSIISKVVNVFFLGWQFKDILGTWGMSWIRCPWSFLGSTWLFRFENVKFRFEKPHEHV
jgi:uncharacterized membrane-anchored protein YitT (DUF2179 family)